jgi:DNA-binding NtrC family response regulator
MNAILFVDDQEVLARLSCKILQMNGYHAEYAYNANDALAIFEREKFDLLVTDYRMEGMNGLELAKLIRQKAPGLPVIIGPDILRWKAAERLMLGLRSRTCSLLCSIKSNYFWARAIHRRL